jgi:hypothetical protein
LETIDRKEPSRERRHGTTVLVRSNGVQIVPTRLITGRRTQGDIARQYEDPVYGDRSAIREGIRT